MKNPKIEKINYKGMEKADLISFFKKIQITFNHFTDSAL